MRVTLDTNVIISGLFWRGAERLILDAARGSRLHLCTSPLLLAELEEVLAREKFAPHLLRAQTDAHALTLGYAALATVFQTPTIDPIVKADPDDDAVLACAEVSSSAAVVSGDRHLLMLERYNKVDIMNARAFLAAGGF